jgi:hypothetical protein
VSLIRFIFLQTLFVLVVAFSGYQLGHRNATKTCINEMEKTRQIAQSATDKINLAREQIAKSREVSREQIRVVYRTIKEKANELIKNEVVPDKVHADITGTARRNPNCDLDADGVRLWNAANAGDATALPSQFDRALPDSAPAEVGQADGVNAQSHRVDGAVRAVPGPAEQTGGVQ